MARYQQVGQTLSHPHCENNERLMIIYLFCSPASLFDALVCFLVYNCADFAGRILSNWYKVVSN